MGLREADLCGYCGRPLRLVAGFCAECLAPAPVARQSRLVADARRRAGMQMMAHGSLARTIAPTVEASAAALAEHPPPRWPASLAILAVVALLVTGASIGYRVFTATPPGFAPLAIATLSVHLGQPDGPEIDTVTTGKLIIVEYGVLPGRDPVDISLTIAPVGSAPCVLTERWPGNAPLRQLRLVPGVGGQWHITLKRNQQVVQTLNLTILP